MSVAVIMPPTFYPLKGMSNEVERGLVNLLFGVAIKLIYRRPMKTSVFTTFYRYGKEKTLESKKVIY